MREIILAITNSNLHILFVKIHVHTCFRIEKSYCLNYAIWDKVDKKLGLQGSYQNVSQSILVAKISGESFTESPRPLEGLCYAGPLAPPLFDLLLTSVIKWKIYKRNEIQNMTKSSKLKRSRSMNNIEPIRISQCLSVLQYKKVQSKHELIYSGQFVCIYARECLKSLNACLLTTKILNINISLYAIT